MSAYTSVTGQIGTLPTYAGGGSNPYSDASFSGLGAWAARLQVASWRGLPFAVRGSQIRRGRKVAVHTYPFRDDVWVEDLGRGTRLVSFSGFLIGDDVFAQRDAMATASEVAGPGTLVHPSIGSMTVSLTEFSAGERADLGRVVEIEFSFIQGGQDTPLFPTTVVSTQSNVLNLSASSLLTTSSDFVSDVTNAVQLGFSAIQGALAPIVGFVSQVLGTAAALEGAVQEAISIPGQIISQVLGTFSSFVALGEEVASIPGQIAGQVLGIINDAGIAFGAVAGLVAPSSSTTYGRYYNSGLTAPLPSTATVETQIQLLAANRATVTAAAIAVVTTALAAPLTMPVAVETAIAAIQDAIPSPADQLRLLSILAAYTPNVAVNTAPIGAAISTISNCFAALVRRTACAALATAAASYQPTSYNDAVAQLGTIATLLDTESVSAADNGDTATYLSLCALRAAVSEDLISRGAMLPSLTTVTTATTQPSLTLAYSLYGDATRSDDLIARANPVAPLFMPLSFLALSS